MRRRPKITELQFDRAAEELRAWVRESVSPFENDTPEKQKRRKQRARDDLLYFFETYLPHYFYTEFGSFHREWEELWPRSGTRSSHWGLPASTRSRRSFPSASRSTTSHIKLRHFIMIVSDTNDQAKGFTLPIRIELEENPRLFHDFGNFFGSKVEGQRLRYGEQRPGAGPRKRREGPGGSRTGSTGRTG